MKKYRDSIKKQGRRLGDWYNKGGAITEVQCLSCPHKIMRECLTIGRQYKEGNDEKKGSVKYLKNGKEKRGTNDGEEIGSRYL